MTGALPLAATHLTKRFGDFVAVDDLSLALAPGTVTGFLGPNGAGKSTTLRMLVGLTRPAVGDVSIFGLPVDQPTARRRLGYLPADAAFLPKLTGHDNLEVLSALHGSDGAVDREHVAGVLTLTAAELARPVREMSSGMRQKLGLVAALQHRPDLVLLDEPANRLDPLVHREFCRLLRQLAVDGRTVLLSSHVLGEVEEVCDQIALIRQGKLIQLAEVDEVRTQAQRRVTVRYAGPAKPPAVLHDAIVTGNVVVGRIPAAAPDLIRQILADPTVVDIEIEPPSLEEVFLDLYDEADGR